MTNLLKKIFLFFSKAPSIFIGALFFYLMPKKTVETILQKWTSNGKGLSSFRKYFYNKLLTFVLTKYYSKNTTSEEREFLKYMCMGKESGVRWAKYYASIEFPNEKTNMIDLYNWLDSTLLDSTIRHVHQVACSSGREIAYYAKKYPKIKFIGSDIDADVVSFCRRKWGHIPNLEFQVVRLDRLNEKEKKILKSDLIYASGGLQYLDEAQLFKFFKNANKLSTKILFAQPLKIDFLMDKHHNSTKRSQFSWNHSYTTLLERTNWQKIKYTVFFFEEHYWTKTVSFYAEN